MPNKKILVIEDDPTVAEAVVDKLRSSGFRTIEKHTGREGLTAFRDEEPDLVILDLMLPDIDGLEVCRRIREPVEDPSTWDHKTPIIMLTARTEESDRVIGLEIGADDYVSKPFSPKELVARTKAILRRTEDRPAQEQVTFFRAAGIELDTAAHEVCLRSHPEDEPRPIKLTAIEYSILATLMRHAGEVVSRDKLMDEVWGYDGFSPNLLQIHVGHIRVKLEDDPRRPRRLLTVRSFGYKIATEPPAET